ncbi:hypothetical protein AA14337_0677 [Acetobacter malorum DSM 14337]|uniref:Uncharacterized protein n=1 Tax=Acetobacter malorum DSM 14337 TaxID=1307910 RepID=A0ABQ0PPM9_9PROT|nr:hypothetical protein AD930_08385 [Acetobacter malorum]GBQ76991.1 hypothetical protein AA14337_0677 [Acetobacter malorum DSM 14337]
MNWTTFGPKWLRDGGKDAQAGLTQWNAEFVGALGALVLRASFEKTAEGCFPGKVLHTKGCLMKPEVS